MERYSIWEGYVPELEKKIATIKHKCEKLGCDFHFEKVGEEYQKRVNPETKTEVNLKFIICEVEGTAVLNGWEFIASVEHTTKGNVFKKAPVQIEIPKRYRESDPYCEHCNSDRARKSTFIVMNTETGEFKQVGHSCLRDFTNGMSASWAAYMASLKDIFKEAEGREVEFWGSGFSGRRYYETKEVLRYAAETIRHFGYVKSDDVGSTKSLVSNFYSVSKNITIMYRTKDEAWEIEEKMESVGFNPDSAEAVKMTEEALAWIRDQEATNDYMHNLKVITSLEYVGWSKFGVLISLFPTWNRSLEREAKRKAEEEVGKASEFVGELGQRIEVIIESVKCITSWETQFGTTYVWKIVGMDGNVFTWKTSTFMNCDKPPVSLKGTVKEHKVYRDVKQTELTRCKVKYDDAPKKKEKYSGECEKALNDWIDSIEKGE